MQKTSGINIKHFVLLNWTYLIKGNRAPHNYFHQDIFGSQSPEWLFSTLNLNLKEY